MEKPNLGKLILCFDGKEFAREYDGISQNVFPKIEMKLIKNQCKSDEGYKSALNKELRKLKNKVNDEIFLFFKELITLLKMNKPKEKRLTLNLVISD